ncbi:hypothetical protein [Halorussus caseinilyticus]|uniref:Uncharacterized protein n=1 Tax=Halorussus caseinilyticus TaxID=3034025 RepID=A0ABD5WH14_9EURY|nr:hypothetical protein [Halorussus sp. DT72]
MASDTASRLRQAAKLAVVLLVLSPLVVRWGLVGTDLFPRVGTDLLVRAAGLGVLLAVVALLIRQKRRSRGRSPSDGFAERPEDRQVEGSGEVYAPYAYNEQRAAHREGERIRERAEEVARTDREARE